MAGSEKNRRDGADDGATESDVEVLRSGREEARVVLDHQLRLLSGIHAKAMRTVRITGVVFGLVLSAATLSDVSQFVNAFTIAGVGCLVLAILSGLLAYSASDPEFGVGTGYLLDARLEPYSESEWFDVLLDGYRDWIDQMERLNGRNSGLLTATQSFLGLGVALLAIGVLVATFAG